MAVAPTCRRRESSSFRTAKRAAVRLPRPKQPQEFRSTTAKIRTAPNLGCLPKPKAKQGLGGIRASEVGPGDYIVVSMGKDMPPRCWPTSDGPRPDSSGLSGSGRVCGQSTREKMEVIALGVVKFFTSAMTFAYSGEPSTARACSTLSNQYSVML